MKEKEQSNLNHVIASEASQSQSYGVPRHCEEGKRSKA